MNTGMDQEFKRLFSPREIAQYLAVSPKTIYKWAFYRKIPVVKLGKALRFDRAEIDRWIEERKGYPGLLQVPAH